ncbi:MAG: hypothetical protein IIC24_03360 [Chloroflexi bacterium]|nr:hypothetical protein [Chloroflexota bacterium]
MRLENSNIEFAPWTHSNRHDPKDPINLVFKKASLKEVISTIGWGRPLPGFKSTQYLHIADEMKAQTDQRTRTFTWPFRRYRYHIRLWDLKADGIVASAHRETIPIHLPQSFEQAEKTIAFKFANDASWSVSYDILPVNNYISHPPTNGYVTKVVKS